MKQVVILCGGRGTRLAPLTDNIPKVLVEINGRSLLEMKLDALNDLVEEVILVVGYKGEKVVEKIGDSYKNLRIYYCWQRERLGTGHAVMQAEPLLKDEFLVLNGDDYYSKEDLINLLGVKYGMVGHEVPNPSAFGILEIDSEGNLVKIDEKPQFPKSNLANIGAFAVDTSIFEKTLEKSHRGEYEYVDYINHLVSRGEPVKVLKANVWMPINNFEELEIAKEKLKELEENF
jgi:NDP-sugar pyrophosphorylase family protein